MPQLSDYAYNSIELAVRASGQQAVADLNAEVRRLANEISDLQLKMNAGSVATVKGTEKLEELSRAYAEATEAATAANRVMAGQSANAMNSTAGAARGMTRALLESSRAFEDVSTGGALGGLNNVPGIFGGIARAAGLASPAVAGVETAASVLATTAFLVYQNWDKIKVLFDDGLSPKLIDDIESVTKALKELTEKEWKTRVDVQDINLAKKELDELTKKKQGFDKLNAPSSDRKATAEAIVQAIVENQGSGGREALTRAVLASTVGPESPEVTAAREKVRELDARIKESRDAGDFEGASVIDLERNRINNSREGRMAVEMQNRRKAVEEQLGAVANGDPAQLKWLQDLYAKNPDKFKAVGVKDTFGQALDEASPEGRARAQQLEVESEAVERAFENSVRNVKDFFGDVKKEQRKAATERNQRVNRDATAIGPGVDEDLEKKLFDAIKAGATPQQAIDAQRAGVLGTVRGRVGSIKGRVVVEDEIAATADIILKKAADAAQNLILESKKPRLDVAQDRKDTKDRHEHDQDVKQAVQQFGPGFDPDLQEARARHAAAGLSMAESKARLGVQLAKKLRDGGLDEDLVNEVTSMIVDKALGKVNNAIQQRLQRGAPNVRVAAQAVAQGMGAKDDASDLAHLRTLANQEKMNGFVGAASAKLAEIEARQANVERGIRTIQNMPIWQKNRPPRRQGAPR